MTDERDERLAEIEKRLDDLEGAVAELAAPGAAPDALDAAFNRLKDRANERKQRQEVPE